MNKSKKTYFAASKFAILFSFLMLIFAHSAYAQSELPDKAKAKMTITGITGDNPDGTIETFAINQQVSNPPPAVGTNSPPTFSLMVTKKIDRATPQLLLVGMSGETLAQVKITWTRINPVTNLEEFSHSITLRHVLVTLVRQRPANSVDPEVRLNDEYEDIAFSFASNVGTPAGIVDWEYALPGGRTIVHTGWDFGRNARK